MIDRLEALASEATPGPWFAADWSLDDGPDLTTIEAHEPEGPLAPGQSSIWPDGIRCIKVAETKNGVSPLPDAAYIAAADPSTVLRLIAALRKADELLSHLERIGMTREEEPLMAALRQALAEVEK